MNSEGIARTAVIVSVRKPGEVLGPDRPEETRQLAMGLGLEVLDFKTYVQRTARSDSAWKVRSKSFTLCFKPSGLIS